MDFDNLHNIVLSDLSYFLAVKVTFKAFALVFSFI